MNEPELPKKNPSSVSNIINFIKEMGIKICYEEGRIKFYSLNCPNGMSEEFTKTVYENREEIKQTLKGHGIKTLPIEEVLKQFDLSEEYIAKLLFALDNLMADGTCTRGDAEAKIIEMVPHYLGIN